MNGMLDGDAEMLQNGKEDPRAAQMGASSAWISPGKLDTEGVSWWRLTRAW